MEHVDLWPKVQRIDDLPNGVRTIWSAYNHNEPGKYAAIKVFDLSDEDNEEECVEFEREVLELVSKTRQPYLAELLDCWTDSSSRYTHLVMVCVSLSLAHLMRLIPLRFQPLYPATLLDYIQWRKNSFAESDRLCAVDRPCAVDSPCTTDRPCAADMLCAAEIVSFDAHVGSSSLTLNQVSALSFLHGRNIIHLDIKPENVLVDLDGHLVLSDFGISMRRPGPTDRIEVLTAGTPGYTAPELIEKHAGAYDFAADIWSLGVTLFEMVSRLSEPYFRNDSYKKDARRLMVLCGAFVDNIPDPNLQDLLRNVKIPLSLSFLDLIYKFSQMLLESPGSRLSVTQIKNHPYFSTVNWPWLNQKRYPCTLLL